jgi:hypothetical protein
MEKTMTVEMTESQYQLIQSALAKAKKPRYNLTAKEKEFLMETLYHSQADVQDEYLPLVKSIMKKLS